MSNEKCLKMLFKLSIEDKEKLREIAAFWDCSESYVIRRAISKIYEDLIKPRREG